MPVLPKRAKLFEFSVALAVMAVCATVLLSRLSLVQENAERIMVEATVRNINSGLWLAQAELMMQGRESELAQLSLASPVSWLQSRPDGYREMDGPVSGGDLQPGEWIWERSASVLHYRPRLHTGLALEEGASLQWKMQPASSVAMRAGLRAVKQYRWVVE